MPLTPASSRFNGGTITQPLVISDGAGGIITLSATTGIASEPSAGTPYYGLVQTGSGGDGLFLESELGSLVQVRASGEVDVIRLPVYAAKGLDTQRATLPADAEVPTSSAFLWIDATPAATKLMVKGKDSGGTVRTAAINLA